MTTVCTMLLAVELMVCTPDGPAPLPPPVLSMPIYATSYNWHLGGINCDHDCSVTANGTRTGPELLGRTAACPLSWLGRNWTTVITLSDGSEWWCVDTFGAAVNQEPRYMCIHRQGCRWVVRVDFAVDDPAAFQFNQWLLDGWTMRWRPMAELQ